MNLSQYFLIFVSCLLTSGEISAKSLNPRFDIGNEWLKSADSWGADGTWNLKSNKDIYVTAISHDLLPSNAEIEASKIKDVLLEMTRGRNASLGLLGINDWHITGNSLKKEKTQTLLTIEGGFHDTHSNAVEFKEIHIWKKEKYESLTINYPADSKFGQSEKPNQLMNRFISSVTEGTR